MKDVHFKLNNQVFEAIKTNNLIQLQELISQGAGLNWKKRPERFTSLTQAVYCENLEMVRVLLQAGAEGWGSGSPNALELAIELENTEIVKVLLESDPSFSQNELRDALCAAVRKGWVAMISTLLNAGADVNRQDESGITPLMEAALSNQVESARFLLEAGADVDKVDTDGKPGFYGKTALYLAAQSGHKDMFKYLYPLTSDHEQRASAQRKLPAELLRIQRSKDKTTCDLFYAIAYATKSGNYASLQKLIEAGANVNAFHKDGITALHEAINIENTKIIRLLIKAGANCELKDESYGWTPLIRAVNKESLEMVQLLVEADADVNVIGSDPDDFALNMAAYGCSDNAFLKNHVYMRNQKIFNYLYPLTSPELQKIAKQTKRGDRL